MNCPFCAEEISDEAAKCRHCGESLDTGRGEGGGLPTVAIVLIALAACAVLCICGGGIAASLLMPALMKAKEKANLTKCSNNLRQLGLATLQYGDDKRFYPHVGALRDLDGDRDTNHTTKKVRTLVYYGYHDYPEGFVCPSSFDMWIPSTNTSKSWFWGGGTNPAQASGLSPLADGAADPTLTQADELSYGWTRKGMSTNVRATAFLAADRAVRDESAVGSGAGAVNPIDFGNHQRGWNVLSADATVSLFGVDATPDPATLLISTDAKGGMLDLADQSGQ